MERVEQRFSQLMALLKEVDTTATKEGLLQLLARIQTSWNDYRTAANERRQLPFSEEERQSFNLMLVQSQEKFHITEQVINEKLRSYPKEDLPPAAAQTDTSIPPPEIKPSTSTTPLLPSTG